MDTSPQGKKNYLELVDTLTPNSKTWQNCLKAFIMGGLICSFGQFLNNTFYNMGFSFDEKSMYSSIILIFLAALLTGLGVYDNIGKWGGAGSFVPITGFSNSMVSSALEFKKEGYVLGVGAKIFIVAGPVIVYGVATSVFVGIIYNFAR